MKTIIFTLRLARGARVLLLLVVIPALFVSCSYAAKHMIDSMDKPPLVIRPDKAVLVIIRPSSLVAPIQVFENYIDGKLIGETRNKSYTITEVQPGVHYVMGKAQNIATFRIDFEAGKIYFLRQEAYPGFFYPNTGYSPMLLEEARNQISDNSYAYLVYDIQHPGDDLPSSAYETTKSDFEREVHEDPARYKDILEYRGYSTL